MAQSATKSANQLNECYTAEDDKKYTFIAGITFVLISTIALPIWYKTTEVRRASTPFNLINSLIGNPHPDQLLSFWPQSQKAGLEIKFRIPIEVSFERHATLVWTESQRKLALRWVEERLIPTLNLTSVGTDYKIDIIYEITNKSSQPGGKEGLSEMIKLTFVKMDQTANSSATFEPSMGRIIVPCNGESGIPTTTTELNEMTGLFEGVVGIGDIMREAKDRPKSLKGSVDYMDYVRSNLAKPSLTSNITLEFVIVKGHDEISLGPGGEETQPDFHFFRELISNLRPLSVIHDFDYRVKHLNLISLPPEWRLKINEVSYEDSSHLSPLLNAIDSISGDVGNCLKFLIHLSPGRGGGQRVDPRPLSFSSPGWGSVIMAADETFNGPNRSSLISELVLHAYLFLGFPLHRLNRSALGSRPESYISTLARSEPWRLSYMARVSVVRNVIFAARNVRNFADLVQSTPNLIVDGTVVEKVERSLLALRQTLALLEEGAKGGLSKALQASYRAVGASNEAYFNPSLLESLYFPDDQKYAIYIPLFLPIGMGLFTFLFALYKSRRRLNKALLTKEKSS